MNKEKEPHHNNSGLIKKEASYYTDLRWIKKHYGEIASLLCKELFPKILDIPGCLPAILEKHFVNNLHLGGDIKLQNKKQEFKNFVFSFFNVDQKFEQSTKSPEELLDEAGYILYPECLTNNDMNQYMRYYANGEEICSFWKNRVDDCRVWFAIKKNVDEIKRENFTAPERQDEYGTSVISIQFTRDKLSTLSIKNRYNHTVPNPDNTFNSNLDEIIPGLTDAFYCKFGVKDTFYYEKGSFKMDNYIMCDDKYFRYITNHNHVFFCPNNYVIDNYRIVKLPDSQMLIDHLVFDFQNKKVFPYLQGSVDAFADSVKNIANMSFSNNVITLSFEDKQDVVVEISKDKEIISISDPNLTTCGDNYMLLSRKIKSIDLPNLQSCGKNFLYCAKHLEHYDFSSLNRVGRGFLMASDNDELTDNLHT